MMSLLPASVVDLLARVFAFVVFDVLRIRRQLILKNIRRAFPDWSEQRTHDIGRASLYHMAMTILETLRARHHSLTAHISWERSDVMDEAMSKGRGVYLMCAHIGNFEALGAAISGRWTSATIPVKYVGRGGFDRYLHEMRTSYKLDPIRKQKKGDGYRAIVKALQDGRPVGFMMDQSRPGEPKIPFFGVPAKTNTSLAAIILKKPAPVVPLMCVRKSLGVHEVVFDEEILLTPTGNDQQDILVFSEIFNRVVEKMIRRVPEQYWWIHNRWK